MTQTFPAEVAERVAAGYAAVSVTVSSSDLDGLDPSPGFVRFPIEITAEIELKAPEGSVAAIPECFVGHLTPQEIVLVAEDGTTIDLGTRSRLSVVCVFSDDSRRMAYTYLTYNTLMVSGSEDTPTGHPRSLGESPDATLRSVRRYRLDQEPRRWNLATTP